jgi:adenosylmethionine-8-amino-7-oxononanoate aminotransferase
LSNFDEVGDVRGRGYFIGIELVRDRRTKAPFPKHRALSFDVGACAFADGLICYPCSGNVNGIDGDTIVIAPPYNATDVELEEIVVRLTRAVSTALSRG